MPYTSPAAQSSGAVAPVSWADSVKAGLDYLANPPACRVYNAGAQTIADAGFLPITFDSERYDTDSMHSTSVNTSRITFNTAGLYLLTGNVLFAGADYASVFVDILHNNLTRLASGTVGTMTDASSNSASVSVATVYKMAVADYVELRAYQNNTTNVARTLIAPNGSPEFAATWIGLG